MLQNERQAGASEAAPLEDANDLLGEIDELLESWQNRLTINNLTLAERYLNGELRLVINSNLLSRGSFNDVQWRAVLQGIGSISGSNCERWSYKRFILPRDWHTQCYDDVPVRGPYRNDRLVLVQSVKFVDHPEKLAPSLVWLQTPKQPVGTCADALYLSRSVGFKFMDRPANRKAGTASGLLPIRHNELPCELVERSAQVVNDIADDAAQAGWHIFADLDPVDQISSLRVIISDDKVWVASVERADFRLQLTDVAFGPFNLDVYAIERWGVRAHGCQPSVNRNLVATMHYGGRWRRRQSGIRRRRPLVAWLLPIRNVRRLCHSL